MTTRTVQLGDPSQAEKGANQQVADVFADATFPLQVFVKNHMPREVVFPEVPGLHLRHVSNATDSKKSVTIASYDLFQRLASSIAQIAELNRYKLAITISDADIVDGSDDAGADTDTDADGSGGSGGTDAAVKTDAGANTTLTAAVKDAAKPSDGLTYEQLKDALKAKGVEFQSNAKKTDLIALLDGVPAVVEGAGGTDAAAAGGAGGQPDATA